MFSATLREWKRKIEQLQQRWRGVRQENERLRKENEALQREKEQLLDEVISAPLPKRCSCGGQVAFDRMEFQYQQEIVRKTFWRRFDIAIGHCKKPSGPANDKRLPSPGASEKSIRKLQGVSRVLLMAADTPNALLRRWTK